MTVAGGSATAEPKLHNALRSALNGLNGRSLVLLLSAAVALGMFAFTLLSRQEIGGETWGYWFFARVFAESGDFIAADRSPLYTLYLNGFRWLGYPTSVTVERLATGLMMMSGIVLMFRSFMGLGLAVFAALLWIPFLQFAEPPVQQLALAFSLMGLVVRRSTDGRNGLGASYALFLMAYMFRGSYVLFILLFIGWDLYRIYRIQRHGLWSRLRQIVISRGFVTFSVAPLTLVVGLLIWFSVMESDHPWSNAFSAPHHGPRLGTQGLLETRTSFSRGTGHTSNKSTVRLRAKTGISPMRSCSTERTTCWMLSVRTRVSSSS